MRFIPDRTRSAPLHTPETDLCGLLVRFVRLGWTPRSVGCITAPYMRLIDPFRRFIVYPALLRAVHAAWMRAFARLPS